MDFRARVVDISPWVAGGVDRERTRASAAIDEALRENTIVQVTGHGIPSSIIDGLATAMDDFFALDPETKRALIAPIGFNRGYTPPRTETLSRSIGLDAISGEPDYFEAFNVGAAGSDYPGTRLAGPEYAGSLWPDIPDFRRRIDMYFDEAGRVTRTLMNVLGDALGVGRTYFRDLTAYSIDTMRLNYYRLDTGAHDRLRAMSEHTDYGFTTLLWADPIPGLQVAHGGRWNDVVPEEGALILMVGDLLGRATNERWQATLHRVKPPVIGDGIRPRRSAMFYHDGNVDGVIEAIPGLLEPGESPIHPPITVGEHLSAKFATERGGARYDGAAREIARLPPEG